MADQNKASHWQQPGEALKNSRGGQARQVNHKPSGELKQAFPIPGTALTAFLRRYRLELLACEMTREVTRALDCVDALLDLVEAQR